MLACCSNTAATFTAPSALVSVSALAKASALAAAHVWLLIGVVQVAAASAAVAAIIVKIAVF